MSQDPGYGPNGEYLAPQGAVSFRANSPPNPVTAGQDSWIFYPFGMMELPAISPEDDESWTSIYLGGA